MKKTGKMMASLLMSVMMFMTVLMIPVTINAESSEGLNYVEDGNEIGLPTQKSGDFMYALLGEEAVICKYVGRSDKVVIPNELDGHKVTRIGVNCFKENFRISSVSIPESVNHISNQSFLSCVSLKQVNIPKEVNYIGSLAFFRSGLNSVTISNKDTYIGIGAFQESALESVTLPEGFTGESLDNSVFKNCTELSSVTLPTSLFRIPMETFDNCASLSSIVLPKGLTEIGEAAFRTSGLESISLPEGVTTMGYYAFKECPSLSEVSLPSTLKTIDDMAFAGCPSIISVNIPNGMTTVGKQMFASCEKLKTVTLADSVTKVGAEAFSDCNSLEMVKMSKNLKVIEDYGFSRTGLKSVTVPGSLSSSGYGYGAFSECKKLTQITFDNKLTIIPSDMFWGCSSLKSITIPSSVKKVMSGAFNECTALESITVMGNTVINDAFEDCENIKKLTLKTMYGLSGGPVKKGTWLYNVVYYSENCVVYAPKGSTGERLAKDYNLKFLAIPVTK